MTEESDPVEPMGIKPPWLWCPNCGHHEMSHKYEGDGFTCVVFLCRCPDPPEDLPAD